MQRIAHSAYFASSVTIVPDFIKAFTNSSAPNKPNHTDSLLHQRLELCLTHMRSDGVGAASMGTPLTPMKRKRSSVPCTPPKPRPVRAAAYSTTKSCSATLAGTVTQLWNRALEYIGADDPSTPFLHAESLQHMATIDIEQRLFNRLHEKQHPDAKHC